MSAYKDFDAALAEQEPSGSNEFSFGGTKFKVPLPLPAAAVFSFITEGNLASVGETRSNLRYIAICQDFLASVVDPEQAADMRTALRRSRADMDFLDDMCRWMIEEGAAVPTNGSEPSSSEPQATGDGSRDSSSSEESTGSSEEAPAEPSSSSKRSRRST